MINMVKKDCYKMMRGENGTFCFNCSTKQRKFCANIVGRINNKCVVIRSKTLKEKGFFCTIHGDELDDDGECQTCIVVEGEALSPY